MKKTKSFGVSLNPRLHTKWLNYCKAHGESISSMTRKAITEKLMASGITIDYTGDIDV